MKRLALSLKKLKSFSQENAKMLSKRQQEMADLTKMFL